MDALIRSARLAPARTRLSEAVAERANPDAARSEARSHGADSQPAPADLAALRARIEQELRDELALQAADVFDAERARGHAQGHAAGLAEAEAQAAREQAQALGELRAQAEASLAVFEQAHRAALSHLEASVGDVAFACVCRLVGRQAPSRLFVLGLVEEVIAGLRAEAIVRVRVHPRDLEVLRALLTDRDLAAPGLRVQALSMDLVPDESLALGGCVVETGAGQYDGGLESQMRRLHQVLCPGSAADAGDALCRS